MWLTEQGRAGCIAYVGGFLTFMSIGGFPSFVEDMKVKRHLHIVIGSISTFRLQLGRSRAWSVKCMVGLKEGQVIELILRVELRNSYSLLLRDLWKHALQFFNSVCNLTVVDDDGSTCLPFISGRLLKAFFLPMYGPARAN